MTSPLWSFPLKGVSLKSNVVGGGGEWASVSLLERCESVGAVTTDGLKTLPRGSSSYRGDDQSWGCCWPVLQEQTKSFMVLLGLGTVESTEGSIQSPQTQLLVQLPSDGERRPTAPAWQLRPWCLVFNFQFKNFIHDYNTF